MNFVYICRPGENEELRYSIRSVLSSFPDAEIWVVGSKPSWYGGNFLRHKDKGTKFTNIHDALKLIASSGLIPDDFIYMNDDFFIIDKIDEIPVMHGGYLEDKANEYLRLDPESTYTRLLLKAHDKLVKRGIEKPLDYDIHFPLPINKKALQTVVELPIMPRSAYGNLCNIGGVKVADVKMYDSGKLMPRSHDLQNSQSSFVSTTDVSFEKLLEEVLANRFPEPSKYEY